MFKKIFILSTLCVLLVSCGENTATTAITDVTENQGIEVKDFTDFSIALPNSWEVIDSKSDSLPTPSE
jgi:hypothetical protein